MIKYPLSRRFRGFAAAIGVGGSALTTGFFLEASSTPACAAALFGDIDGNQVFSGYGMGPGGGVNNAIAEGFTMTQTLTLTSVDTYLSQYQTAAGSSFALSIFSDAGNTPGVDLYDLSANLAAASGGTPVLVTWTGTGSFTLTSGVKYWLELYATNPTSVAGSTMEWNDVLDQSFNFVNPTGPDATDDGELRTFDNGGVFSGSPSTNEQRTSFALNGTTVPEPTSAALLGLSGLLLIRRRRVNPVQRR